MSTLKDLNNNKELINTLETFLSSYNLSGLEEALRLYSDLHQTYICRTKASTTKIKISDINYITIQGHHIEIHTSTETYQKYGSLDQELKTLSSCGFMKCTQSCIVSLYKIKEISQNELILLGNEHIHMSRKCAPQILIAYNRQEYSAK